MYAVAGGGVATSSWTAVASADETCCPTHWTKPSSTTSSSSPVTATAFGTPFAEAIYGDLAPGRRRQIHARVAREALARHPELGGPARLSESGLAG